MMAGEHNGSSARRWPFGLVLGLLVVITLAEWTAYAVRADLAVSDASLVPLMLALTLAKLLLAVAWLQGRVQDVSLGQKVALAVATVAGSATIMALLLTGH